MVTSGQWTFNEFEDGVWGHDTYGTKEEAIKAAQEYFDDDNDVLRIGRTEVVPLPSEYDADEIFERLDEIYGEECCSDVFDGDYLFDDVKQEDKDWFQAQLNELISKLYERSKVRSPFYTVGEIEEIRKGEEADVKSE